MGKWQMLPESQLILEDLKLCKHHLTQVDFTDAKI